jgi:ABC-type Zn uptake system ZnuABC Zn-binding protein ZnuA
MNARSTLLVAAAMLATLPACSQQADAPAPEANHIVVSVPPLAWLARTVAPEAEITVLVPQGASPHGYEMTPQQASALREADVVLLVGLGLEPAGVETAIGPARDGRVIIHLEDGLGPMDDAEMADAHDHSIDPHLWLDPESMRFGAAQLAAALERSDATAETAISAIEREYSEALAPFAGDRIIGVHDAWSRLAARFGLEAPESIMERFEIEATPGAIEDAASALRSGTPAVIVLEPQMDPSLPRRLSELTGAPIAELDPIGGEDWPATMRTNLARLVAALTFARAGEEAE